MRAKVSTTSRTLRVRIAIGISRPRRCPSRSAQPSASVARAIAARSCLMVVAWRAKSTVRCALTPVGWTMRTVVRTGARKVLPPPAVDRLLEGRMVELPGRGRTFVIDVPGPTPDAPVVVLLHALGLHRPPRLGAVARRALRRPTG